MKIVRAMVRYRQRASQFEAANNKLRTRLRDLAEQRRRWRYRRLHILLEREGWQVNNKWVYRIYVEEKLVVRRRRRRRCVCARARALLSPPTKPNETWTMDFLHDTLAGGRKLRTLSIEDAYTREMPVIERIPGCRRCAWCACWRSCGWRASYRSGPSSITTPSSR